MEDDHRIPAADLLDQMGRPQDRDLFTGAKCPDVFEDRPPAGDVETDRRFVEQQERGLVQKCPSQLGAATLAAAEVAQSFICAPPQAGPRKLGGNSRLGPISGDPVERGVITQILPRGKIAIEARFLKYDPDSGQHLGRPFAGIEAEDAHLARPATLQTRQSQEQRRLAGPVQTQQYRQGSPGDRKRDTRQRLACAIRMMQILDPKSRGVRIRGLKHKGTLLA